MAQALSLSLVIPVYNEENYIARCLDSVASQTVAPKEVFVVDNNCSDATIAIAKKYSFVTILSEKRQHQVFAQATAFNVAKGDIFGRVDADCQLAPDWVEKTLSTYQNKQVVGVTGDGYPYDVHLFEGPSYAMFKLFLRHIDPLIANTKVVMWGSNMSFRGELWPFIKPNLLYRRDIWEDYDIGFQLYKHGKLVYRPDIFVGCSFRQIHTPLAKQLKYQFRSVRLYNMRFGSLRATIYFAVKSLALPALSVLVVSQVLYTTLLKKND